MVEDGRIELPLHACKAHVLPLSLIPPIGPSREIRTPDPLVPNQMRYQTALYSVFILVPDEGFEPSTYRLQGGCTTPVLIRQNLNYFLHNILC